MSTQKLGNGGLGRTPQSGPWSRLEGNKKIDDSEVEQLLRSGWSQMRVVRLYADRGLIVSQSAISQAITAGRIKVDTDRGTSGVPWRLKPEHRHRHAARMLRTQARLDAGKTIGSTLAVQVESWRAGLELEDSVVHYDPDTPEGFWRVPRRPGIDTWWYRDPNIGDDGLPTRG